MKFSEKIKIVVDFQQYVIVDFKRVNFFFFKFISLGQSEAGSKLPSSRRRMLCTGLGLRNSRYSGKRPPHNCELVGLLEKGNRQDT